VISALGFRSEFYLGLRTIRLDTVVGTVEETRDFDRGFRPVPDRDRQRWELLDQAERSGAVIPPVEVYRVGGCPPPAFPGIATRWGPEPGGLRCHGLRSALRPVAGFMGEASGTLRYICTMSNSD
jgi:hypothetical protein